MRIKDCCEIKWKETEAMLPVILARLPEKRFCFLFWSTFKIPHSDKYPENSEAVAGSRWTQWNRSAQEGPEVATIWCLSCGCMKGAGGVSPAPSGQVFETENHPYNWHPWWVLHRRARIKSRGDQITLPPGAGGPSRQGWGSVTETGQPELNPSLLLSTLCFAEKSQVLAPRAVSPTTFIDTVIFTLYFHLATTVSKN